MKRSVSVAGFYLVFLVFLSLSSAAQTKAGGLSPDEIKDQLYKDSLEKALTTAPDSVKLKLLFFLDQAYISNNPTKSLEYDKERLAIAEKLNNLHVQASAYISMSRPALYKNDIPDAKTWLERGYALAEKQKDSALMVRALLNLGTVSQAASDQTATLDYYLRALRIAKAIRDTPMMNMSSINIGTVYVSEANYAKAKEYTLPVLPLIDSTRGDPQQAPKAMELLGIVYFKENKFELAWQYYRNAIRLYAKQKNDQGLATIYSHLAGFYLNKPDSLLYFALKAKAIWDRINPDYFMVEDNIANIAAAYYTMATDSLHPARENKTALLRKAGQYLSIAIETARKTHRVEVLIIFYGQLARVQNLLHEYQQAYDNSVKAYDLNDSLYSQNEKNKVASLDEKYQVQLREDQLAANRKSLAIQARQKYYLIAGIILLVVIGGLLYWQNRTRKRVNTTLLTLNSQLDEANEVKTRFVGILNHDLKAPVANLINILHLQKEGAGIIDESTAAAHAERIKAQAENLLETMEDLLSWSKGQMKNFQPQWTNVSVSDLFTDIASHFSGTPQVTIRFSAPEGMILHTDEYFLKTIMRNLTSNAIKSLTGRSAGTIEWSAREEDGKQVLSITDNGPGITQSQLQPLYDGSLPSSLKAGLGLHLVRDLSKAIACLITVSVTPGKGTEFRLFV
jgi:signal transduction histidine kinase